MLVYRVKYYDLKWCILASFGTKETFRVRILTTAFFRLVCFTTFWRNKGKGSQRHH